MLVLRGISYPPSWGFEGTDLAALAHLECPTVCHGEPWREEDFCVIPTVCHGHPVQSFSVPPLSSKLGRGRREEDSCVIPTVCHGHPVQILLLSISLEQAQIRLFVIVFCGERGIRTPETLLEFTRFPGVPLQPLEHLSFVATGLQEETRPASLACRRCSS